MVGIEGVRGWWREGALLVALVLYLFLSNMRASLSEVVVIPLSLLATFMGLKIMGVPANLLSLGAMGVLLVWRHAENINRLIAGKESRLGAKKKP